MFFYCFSFDGAVLSAMHTAMLQTCACVCARKMHNLTLALPHSLSLFRPCSFSHFSDGLVHKVKVSAHSTLFVCSHAYFFSSVNFIVDVVVLFIWCAVCVLFGIVFFSRSLSLYLTTLFALTMLVLLI